jgi:hypothetical protein
MDLRHAARAADDPEKGTRAGILPTCVAPLIVACLPRDTCYAATVADEQF